MTVLAEMNVPFLYKPIKTQLRKLEFELHRQWKAFNRELKQGKLKHVIYDKETQKLTWHKPAINCNKVQDTRFYEQRPFCDVAYVFQFVNGQCNFLHTMKSLQPCYAKKTADTDSLLNGGHRCSSDESW